MPSYDPDRDGGTNDGATLRRLNDKIVIHPVSGRWGLGFAAARGVAGRARWVFGGRSRSVARSCRALARLATSPACPGYVAGCMTISRSADCAPFRPRYPGHWLQSFVTQESNRCGVSGDQHLTGG